VGPNDYTGWFLVTVALRAPYKCIYYTALEDLSAMRDVQFPSPGVKVSRNAPAIMLNIFSRSLII